MRYCDEFAALLDVYVDGELSPGEMARVQAHLDTCPGCRAYVDDALAIRAAFPEVEETEVPDGFSDGVMAVIRAEAVPQRKRKAPWFKMVLPLAACLAIVVLVQDQPMNSFRSTSTTADTAAPASVEMAETEEAVIDAADNASTQVRESGPQESMEDQSAGKQAPENAPAGGQDAPMLYTAQAETTEGAESAPEPFAAEARHTAYFVVLTLTEEAAGSLLDGSTPVAADAESLQYELTAADYEALVSALSEAGVSWEETSGTAGAETALVTVIRSS